MYLKAFIFVLVSYSCAFMAFSLTGFIQDPACIQKLMPCQPYLKPSVSSPPATCCAPLKEMIVDDVGCLCSIFDNKELLSQFNITQDDALRLPKLCGAQANLSLCKNGTATPASPATPTASNSSAPSESTEHKKNAANTVAYSSGLSYFALSVLSLVLSAM